MSEITSLLGELLGRAARKKGRTRPPVKRASAAPKARTARIAKKRRALRAIARTPKGQQAIKTAVRKKLVTRALTTPGGVNALKRAVAKKRTVSAIKKVAHLRNVMQTSQAASTPIAAREAAPAPSAPAAEPPVPEMRAEQPDEMYEEAATEEVADEAVEPTETEEMVEEEVEEGLEEIEEAEEAAEDVEETASMGYPMVELMGACCGADDGVPVFSAGDFAVLGIGAAKAKKTATVANMAAAKSAMAVQKATKGKMPAKKIISGAKLIQKAKKGDPKAKKSIVAINKAAKKGNKKAKKAKATLNVSNKVLKRSKKKAAVMAKRRGGAPIVTSKGKNLYQAGHALSIARYGQKG